jgi:ElaB/YqjD/DUF883 family membrane-anchored ribosome-binding protein
MSTTDKATHFAQDTVDSINSAGHHAKEAFDERSEQLLHAEKCAVRQCRSYIRTNPVASLSIAAAAGFLLGGLLGISRR